ncbi:hypothetical protein BCR39DRAFT_554075 [Naematelia encephala]|uniref:BRCT domain-containing protein n=1 Tax=Naematelia encephala TaxID=71784 RepID=A0A1Y2AF61_9TREE|nr:hypothetical protein BCR39DRAFT_554075 [Naematelia encephala]
MAMSPMTNPPPTIQLLQVLSSSRADSLPLSPRVNGPSSSAVLDSFTNPSLRPRRQSIAESSVVSGTTRRAHREGSITSEAPTILVPLGPAQIDPLASQIASSTLTSEQSLLFSQKRFFVLHDLWPSYLLPIVFREVVVHGGSIVSDDSAPGLDDYLLIPTKSDQNTGCEDRVTRLCYGIGSDGLRFRLAKKVTRNWIYRCEYEKRLLPSSDVPDIPELIVSSSTSPMPVNVSSTHRHPEYKEIREVDKERASEILNEMLAWDWDAPGGRTAFYEYLDRMASEKDSIERQHGGKRQKRGPVSG